MRIAMLGAVDFVVVAVKLWGTETAVRIIRPMLGDAMREAASPPPPAVTGSTASSGGAGSR